MRLFIAIPLSAELVFNAKKLCALLDPKKFKIVDFNQLHLTILFLGEFDNAQNIRAKLRSVRFAPFTLRTRGFGFFPSDKKISSVWLGLEKSDDLMNLQKIISAVFDQEGDFVPHITLARPKKTSVDKNMLLKDALSKIRYSEVSLKVEKIVLYESKMEEDRHKYHVIEEFRAAKAKK